MTVQDKSLCDLIKKLQTTNAVLKLGEETTQIAPREHHREWKKQKEETVLANMAMGFKDHKASIHHENSSKSDGLSRQFPCQVGSTLEATGTSLIARF